MGAMSPKKQPAPQRKKRRDDTDFDVYAMGGVVVKQRKRQKK